MSMQIQGDIEKGVKTGIELLTFDDESGSSAETPREMCHGPCITSLRARLKRPGIKCNSVGLVADSMRVSD